MDNLKISHVYSKMVVRIIIILNDKYVKEAPLTINLGEVHGRLRMKIYFSSEGEVIIWM